MDHDSRYSKTVKKFPLYIIVTENYRTDDGRSVSSQVALTPTGDYIGTPKRAKFLCDKKGIAPEVRPDSHSRVCSIGFSRKDGKWYGWSHRAMFGLGIIYKSDR